MSGRVDVDYTAHQARLVRTGAVAKTLTVTHPNGQSVAQPVRCWSMIGPIEEYVLADGTVVAVVTKGLIQ